MIDTMIIRSGRAGRSWRRTCSSRKNVSDFCSLLTSYLCLFTFWRKIGNEHPMARKRKSCVLLKWNAFSFSSYFHALISRVVNILGNAGRQTSFHTSFPSLIYFLTTPLLPVFRLVRQPRLNYRPYFTCRSLIITNYRHSFINNSSQLCLGCLANSPVKTAPTKVSPPVL